MFDDDIAAGVPRPALVPPAHEIGTDLAAISVDELRARVALLEREIARLGAEVVRKEASRRAASDVFRI